MGRDPRGSRSSRIPPPRVAVPSGGGGASPRLRGGRGPLLWLPSWGGVRRGGLGGPPPHPRPVGCRPAFHCPRRAPPGVYSCRGCCRAAAGGPVGRRQVSAAGGGGEGGGTPPPWFAPPSSPGRPLIRPLCLRRPGRRRSAVGRQQAGRSGACFGRGAPAPRVQRPLRGGCGAAVSSVRLHPLLGLSGRGGGEWGRPSGPLATPPDGRGGGGMAVPAPGASHRLGGRALPPPPLYLEPDPRAGPRWGPSSPRRSSRGAGRPGAAVRVSGQRLAGCGAAGSPPRSLSPPSLPREVARSPASCRTVGGAWVGGPSSPPKPSRVRRLGRHLRRRLCGGWGSGSGALRRR